jgi:hypothetical protein
LKISVYSGLTLRQADVTRILPRAKLHPPAKQFDLLADIREGVHAVLIVDGVFHQTPAVSPTEIMDALRRGLLVYGCSSMGALRAAELYPYGMRGIGKIYEWIRREPAFRDDYPGQVFSTEGDTIRPLSFTHVDFVFNLQELSRRGRLEDADRELLERLSRDTYYPDRTLARVVHELRTVRPDLVPLATHALTAMGSQKRRDALKALQALKSHLHEVSEANLHFATRPTARRQVSRDVRKGRGAVSRGAQ